MERLATRASCLSFDHRATGDRLPSNIEQTIAELAADAVALLDALGIERADIVGHSFGGTIAQQIAIHQSQRINRLVLSATWAGPTPFFDALFDLRKQVLQHCGLEAYLLQGALLSNPGWFNASDFDRVMAGVTARHANFAGAEIEMDRMHVVSSHDLRAQIPNIRAETLVLCARDDQIAPPPLSEELARLIPNARLEILAEGNHFAPAIVPDAYGERLERFLV